MKLNLFSNWFDSQTRPQEFQYCRDRNLRIFDRVIYYNGRPTFSEYFKDMAKFQDSINVLANLDIYFDETIKLTQWLKEDVVYCLTRHEDDGKGNIQTFAQRNGGHPGEWSQDAWVFTGSKIAEVEANFHLGDRGCDNHLAYVLHILGYKLLNPALDIRAIHMHNIDRGSSHDRGEFAWDREKFPNQSMKVELSHLKML